MTTTPTCETCAYYMQHYVARNGRYRQTSCGHCVAPRRRKCGTLCYQYQPAPIPPDPELTKHEILKEMSKRLNEIKNILKSCQ